jgi:hypothetical protein
MELQTRAYIPVHSSSGEEIGPIFKEPIPALQHKELVLRQDVEVYIRRLEEQLAGALRQAETLAREKTELLDDLQFERKMHARELDARHQQDNRMLDIMMALQRARPGFGFPSAEEARDIVVAAYKPRNRVLRALRMLVRGY